MSDPGLPARVLCAVCGQGVTSEICRCAACETPCHVECFSYAGGCSTFGCGSTSARMDGTPPPGWMRVSASRALEPVWGLPPATRRPAPLPGRAGSHDQLRAHWAGLSQLELFVVIGQVWFCGVCLVAAGLGLWSTPLLLSVCVAVTLLSHLHTLGGLVALKVCLLLGDGAAPHPKDQSAATTLKVARIRLGTVQRSWWLVRIATLLLVPALALSARADPLVAVLVSACAVIFPWLSLVPRWRVEWPILEAALAGQTPLLEDGHLGS